LDYVHVISTTIAEGKSPPPQAAFLGFPGTIAALLSSLLDIKGPSDTISGGCPSGMDAVGFASRCIAYGILDAAIVVGADNEACPITFNGIAAANGLSSSYNSDPKKASRPFDKNREGNVIGENACALVIESKSHAIARKAPQM
jgi:3-oxoacyl-(acyl-carrier-protein) synthase